MPQGETTGTASAPGPCNYLQVRLSHIGEIPTRNVSSTPHRRGQQLPLPQQFRWTQRAQVNPLQSGFSSRQQYGPDLPHPPPKAGETTDLSPAGYQQGS